MNEPEILQAYGRLSTPVSAPPDVLDRVEKRIVRRRRARQGTVAVAALAVVGGVGVTALGGGDGREGQVAADPGSTETSTLVATLSDGSTQAFRAADIAVACNAEGTRLWLARNSMTQSFLDAEGPAETAVERPVLIVELVVGDVRPGQVFDLPFDSRSGDTDDRSMTFFFTADEGRDRDNELSSAEPGSSGTVTVHEASCGATPTLWLEVDGTIGSEVEQPALGMTGEYRS